MEKLPTAKEFLESRNFSSEEPLDNDVAEQYLVDFGILCIEAALKAASESVDTGPMGVGMRYRVKISILTAFPPENIQ